MHSDALKVGSNSYISLDIQTPAEKVSPLPCLIIWDANSVRQIIFAK